jgi:hypothetical protein
MPRGSTTAPVDQLRTLNDLLGQLCGAEQAGHARRALEFVIEERPDWINEERLGDCVDRLAALHVEQQQAGAGFAFAHWHVPRAEDFSPLWIRQSIVTEMKKLAGRRQGLLLVTGLREAVCPPGKYWTERREFQYRRVSGWVEDLAAAWASRGSRLQVVVF